MRLALFIILTPYIFSFSRLRFYVIMTSQRELFPRLTADMRRFKKPPQLQRDAQDLDGASEMEKQQRMELESQEESLEGEASRMGTAMLYHPHLFPLLGSEVSTAQRQLVDMVQLAKCHCRRDNLWKRLYLLEPLSSDKLRLGKLNSSELKELLDAVHGRSVAEIDPQLVRWQTGSITPSTFVLHLSVMKAELRGRLLVTLSVGLIQQ